MARSTSCSRARTFSRADYTGDRLTLRKVWHICHGRDVLTQTTGLFPASARSDDMVYFVAIGADDTLLRIDVYGNQETAVHQFVGAHVRSLAVTRDRHASRFDFDPSSDELLVSVSFSAQLIHGARGAIVAAQRRKISRTSGCCQGAWRAICRMQHSPKKRT